MVNRLIIPTLVLSLSCSFVKAQVDASANSVIGTRRFGLDWKAFLGPTGDSKSTETGLIVPWAASGPKVVWQKKLTESYGIGSVAYGRYYQFDFQDGNAVLSCLESETGKHIWDYSYPSTYQDLYGYNSGPRCSPIIDGDRVYIYGVEGMLHCVHALTGKKIWAVNVSREFGVIQNFFGVGSNPVVYQDLLLVMVGGSPEEDKRIPPGQLDRVRGNGSGIVAFDKLTGRVRYKLSDELASYASLKLAEQGGRDWCFAFARNSLIGFEPGSGKIALQYPWRARILESVNASVPVVVNDRVFISETYGPGSALLRFDADGHEVVWTDNPRSRKKSMQTHWNTAIHHEGYLYGSSGRHEYNAELRCIEMATGKVQWSEPGLTRSSLLYVDDHFICLSEDGTLRLIRANPKAYELVSEIVYRDLTLRIPSNLRPEARDGYNRLLKPPAWAAPILSHGLLYVRGRDRVLCLEVIKPPTN